MLLIGIEEGEVHHGSSYTTELGFFLMHTVPFSLYFESNNNMNRIQTHFLYDRVW